MKSILIDDALHKKLRLHAIDQDLSLKDVVETALKKVVGNEYKSIVDNPGMNIPISTPEKKLEKCSHGKEKTYCIVKKCPNYASWR